MKNSRYNDFVYTKWIIDEIVAGRDTGLISALAKKFEISRPTSSRIIKTLIDKKRIKTSGSLQRPIYSLGKNREIVFTYKREDIDENLIWARDFLPFLDLRDNVKNIVHHGFTEMMNNAHDHSNAKFVIARIHIRKNRLHMGIADNGVGIFEKISSSLNLPDKRLALLELSKGKLTTDPRHHSGEGIFFTSRMFDHFSIRANNLNYVHNVDRTDDILDEIPEWIGFGTIVLMSISLNSTRTTREIFDQYTMDHPHNLSFNRTVVPVRLARLEGENLISRSQGKRLVARFEGFRKVVLDFSDIDEIGQAFADEVFRVFADNHPEVQLEVQNATDYVQRMIRRITDK